MPARPRRSRARRIVIGGGAAILAISGTCAVFLVRDKEPAATTTATLPTATVTRTDMSNATEVDGKLGYAGSYTVLAAGQGRITWLPSTGKVIKRGQQTYGVNGRPVLLFYGSMPFWRPLKLKMPDGYDVLELERNLTALGYGSGLSTDRTFSSATESAVKQWQADLGLSKTGTVSPADVVIQRGRLGVASVTALLGGPAEGTIFTATGTERRVTVSLPVAQQEIAKKGAKVRVMLPGGKTTAGRISSIGTLASAGKTNAQSQAGQSTETATISVFITLAGSKGAGTLQGAPATVSFTTSERKGVLSVPVNALLASADGSYSVNVVDGSGKVTSVPVKLGIFGGDNVEVSGNLTEGAKVQVPKS